MPFNVALRTCHSMWHSAHANVCATHCGIQNMSIWHSNRHSTWHSAHATQCGILHMLMYVPLTVAFRTCQRGILTVTRRGILYMPLNVALRTCRSIWHSAHINVRATHCGIQNMSMWHSNRHSTWHSAHATQCGIRAHALSVAFCTCHPMWHSAHATQCDILHTPMYVQLTVAFRTCQYGILTVTRRGILHMPFNVAFCTCPQRGILYMSLNVAFCTCHSM